jgi:hypothetical protein
MLGWFERRTLVGESKNQNLNEMHEIQHDGEAMVRTGENTKLVVWL